MSFVLPSSPLYDLPTKAVYFYCPIRSSETFGYRKFVPVGFPFQCCTPAWNCRRCWRWLRGWRLGWRTSKFGLWGLFRADAQALVHDDVLCRLLSGWRTTNCSTSTCRDLALGGRPDLAGTFGLHRLPALCAWSNKSRYVLENWRWLWLW